MRFRVTIRDRRAHYPDAEHTDVLKVEDADVPVAPYALLTRAEHPNLLVNLDYYELILNYCYE